MRRLMPMGCRTVAISNHVRDCWEQVDGLMSWQLVEPLLYEASSRDLLQATTRSCHILEAASLPICFNAALRKSNNSLERG